MKLLVEIKGHTQKQVPQITKLFEEFCLELSNQVAIESCECTKYLEVKDGKSKTETGLKPRGSADRS